MPRAHSSEAKCLQILKSSIYKIKDRREEEEEGEGGCRGSRRLSGPPLGGELSGRGGQSQRRMRKREGTT